MYASFPGHVAIWRAARRGRASTINLKTLNKCYGAFILGHKVKRIHDKSSVTFRHPTRFMTIAASNYSSVSSEERNTSHSDMTHRVFIALGSNLGDRFDMIEKACQAMEATNIRIVRTSSLWETSPMYVERQGRFINGVCEVATTLEPAALLNRLQSIENELGRVKVVDKGPRNIDLDILLYDSRIIESTALQVPHKLMLEREFVLRPLCQLIPDEMLPQPLSPRTTFRDHLRALHTKAYSSSSRAAANRNLGQDSPRVPVSPRLPLLAPLLNSRKTELMSILNLTPDSFSDGGKLPLYSSSALSTTIYEHVHQGAVIIDIGGQSSRPGAADITATEEFSRVLPAIEACKRIAASIPVAISVDTYRAEVAEAAVKAGADIINDISAGLLDPNMLPTIARLDCTYILMHMRGTPQTMTSKENCTYNGDLIQVIANELFERIAAAEAAGIRRWRMILDPGIGFAKTKDQNLEVLRRFDELRNHPRLEGFPWVVGVSRKGFVGTVTGVKAPSQRIWGTAAAVATAVQKGADIVRVHDVKEMAQVVRMADAIWRV